MFENMDARAWYVRWFIWSLGIYDKFNDSYKTQYLAQQGTNLCFAVRVTVFYAPLIILLEALAWTTLVAVLTWVPATWLGGGFYLKTLGFITLIVGVAVAVYMVSQYIQERRDRKRRASRTANPWPEEEISSRPRFPAVVKEVVMAKKRKICPLITFNPDTLTTE